MECGECFTKINYLAASATLQMHANTVYVKIFEVEVDFKQGFVDHLSTTKIVLLIQPLCK